MLQKREVMDTKSMAVSLLINILYVPLHTSGHGHRDQRPLVKSTASSDILLTSLCSCLHYQLEVLLPVQDVIFMQLKQA